MLFDSQNIARWLKDLNFYVLVVRTISYSFAALTRKILFLQREHKIHIFSPPCNIPYMYVYISQIYIKKTWPLYDRKKIPPLGLCKVEVSQPLENVADSTELENNTALF